MVSSCVQCGEFYAAFHSPGMNRKSDLQVSLTFPFKGLKIGRFAGGVPERLKGADCKSAGSAFEGSNPSPSTSGAVKRVIRAKAASE